MSPDAVDNLSMACRRHFAFLVERFGFEPPEIKQLGRETFVQYHRGDCTVSIAWEAGMTPILELFHPPRSRDEPVVPWAERNGVARTRRFPSPGQRLESRFDPASDERLDKYFAELASRFAEHEGAWLAT